MSEQNIRLLVICTANICRSPVVEALLRKKLEARGLEWQVSSSGLLGVEGWAPAAESTALMAAEGIDISAHRSSAATPEMLEQSALVLCMERAHVANLCALHPPAKGRIHRLAEMAGEPRDISDPYGGPLDLFERMVEEVEDLLERGMPRIVDLASRQ